MYITEGDVENFLLQDIDGSYSDFVSTVISAVGDYIDRYCGTSFSNSSSADKYYDTFGTDELVIDPVQSISALTILDAQGNTEMTLTENTDYWLYPLNETIKSRIVLAGGKLAVFPERTRAVKITTVSGYATVPGPIKVAALKLVAKILEKGLKGGEASAESLGEYSIDYKEVDEVSESMQIKNVLDMYREIRI